MNETLQKAENYLHRAEQGYYTEIGEGDSLLRKLVNEVKAFFSQDENPLPPVEEPTTGDEANDPVLPPTPDAPVGTEGPEGEIPAETSETASVAPEANQEETTQEPVAEAQAEPAIPEAGPAPETTSAP